MADTTHTFRMSEERKQQILSAMEASGLDKKEWFEQVMRMYELDQAKNVIPEFATDVKEMEVHISRVQELVLSIAKRAYHKHLLTEEELQEQLREKNEYASTMKEQAEAAQSELAESQALYKELKTQYEGLKEEHTRLGNVHASSSILVDSLQKRVDHLQGIEEKLEELNKKNDELVIQVQEERQARHELQQQLKEIERQLKEEEDARQAEKERYGRDKEQIHELHTSQMAALENRLTMEKENVTQALNAMWQGRISEVKENHAEKVESLYIQIERMREEYEQKLEGLRQKLSDLKSE